MRMTSDTIATTTTSIQSNDRCVAPVSVSAGPRTPTPLLIGARTAGRTMPRVLPKSSTCRSRARPVARAGRRSGRTGGRCARPPRRPGRCAAASTSRSSVIAMLGVLARKDPQLRRIDEERVGRAPGPPDRCRGRRSAPTRRRGGPAGARRPRRRSRGSRGGAAAARSWTTWNGSATAHARRDERPRRADRGDEQRERRDERGEVVAEHRVLHQQHHDDETGPPPDDPDAAEHRSDRVDPRPGRRRRRRRTVVGAGGAGRPRRGDDPDAADREHRGVAAEERRHELQRVRTGRAVARLVEVVPDVVVHDVRDAPGDARATTSSSGRDAGDEHARRPTRRRWSTSSQATRIAGPTRRLFTATAAPTSSAIVTALRARRVAAVGERDRDGRGRERGGRPVAGDRAGGPEQHAARRGERAGEERAPAVEQLGRRPRRPRPWSRSRRRPRAAGARPASGGRGGRRRGRGGGRAVPGSRRCRGTARTPRASRSRRARTRRRRSPGSSARSTQGGGRGGHRARGAARRATIARARRPGGAATGARASSSVGTRLPLLSRPLGVRRSGSVAWYRRIPVGQ